jgi:hypothetical protein
MLKVAMLPSEHRKCRYPFKKTAGSLSFAQRPGGGLSALGLQ